MSPAMLRLALVLGLMGAIGPFAIDMYLPALPTIAADYGTSVAAT
ncbi:MAG: Bcr/CflA family drug resistance efflux transporter, partial [Hyphomicrobiales bacterium]